MHFVLVIFQIAVLSWWQRKAASAFVAEPPSSTVDEALENFLKVELKNLQCLQASHAHCISCIHDANLAPRFLLFKPKVGVVSYSGSATCYKNLNASFKLGVVC